ncbi:C4-dicarboxylate ABC transporter [Enterovibrio norvegicus]|uniref:TRAP transporter large permease protein n=1 Tax=Enterovibrio norvegicus DSM 15893 TaxID=1121869 RepID=A0A1I5S2T2_9GAMM|nr:TRAP transporter large permease subunit [Enterovibrio norvegicus]MCC4800849.1 TRAP transporter large permease subunit [Enterovibrio norvegicus]PMH72004.1 C4-dicarboxylate ABC transporter [Enterovibrio norvegicus]PMI26395.1 C4-dicarboxylate ABC transporter [Enterovibrio norvegicus]PMI38776.1 C4-dicarboxylate ABC transporter [Enterovibrio norvegicus]PMN47507.1 C4-dicarboxylate ABC transporter [Enterovibrio norvegicus]
MEANEILILAMFGSFILLLFIGIPVAWVLGGVGVAFAIIGYYSDIYFDTWTGLDFTTLGLVVNRLFKIMDNWILVALPMFIFMGNMLDKSGVADRLMHAMQALFGRVHGGLAITVMAIGIILAASTGIIGASVVLLATMSLPAMMKQGYHLPLALGTIASAGTLGILLPPSIMLVIMADQLALSVGDLFMGAMVPGLMLGAIYIVYLLIVGLVKPQSIPLPDDAKPVDWEVIKDVAKAIVPTFALILAVLGSIFSGIATPTEASGVGAFGAILLAAFYKRFSLSVLREVLIDSYKTTAYIFAIFIGATCFALVLRELGGDEFIEQAFEALPFGPYGVVAFILLVIFLLGFFLDWIEITLIVLPLLAPVVLGLDLDIGTYPGLDNAELVWFVMLVAMALQTSFLTPPVGFALFYLKGVCPPEVRLIDIYKGVLPFIILQLIALVVLVFWPNLILWLPSVAYG